MYDFMTVFIGWHDWFGLNKGSEDLYFRLYRSFAAQSSSLHLVDFLDRYPGYENVQEAALDSSHARLVDLYFPG